MTFWLSFVWSLVAAVGTFGVWWEVDALIVRAPLHWSSRLLTGLIFFGAVLVMLKDAFT